jgi:nucleotide-binding universal stress UspA family protein
VKKLLIAYDGSPCADAVLEELSQAGLPSELEVLVVSVADVWLPSNPDQLEPVFPDGLPKAVRKAREQALRAVEVSRAVAECACKRLKGSFPKWKLQPFATGDSPAWAIVKKADMWRADLIVLGSHGRGAVERFFLGSVAAKVAAEAHCSVRIARPRPAVPPTPLRIMIAVDGSAASAQAVQVVARRAWPAGTEIHLGTVIDHGLRSAMAWPSLYTEQWLRPADEETSEWIGRMVEHFARQLRNAGRSVETRIFEGDPKAVLLKEAEAWSAHGLFVGAHGLHHGERRFLGSLAAAVAARAHCSVEIVRSEVN